MFPSEICTTLKHWTRSAYKEKVSVGTDRSGNGEDKKPSIARIHETERMENRGQLKFTASKAADGEIWLCLGWHRANYEQREVLKS
jgi:hypothetical protein